MFDLTRQLLVRLNRWHDASRLLSWPEDKGLRIAVFDAGGDADQIAQCLDALETFHPQSDITLFAAAPLSPAEDYPGLKSLRIMPPGDFVAQPPPCNFVAQPPSAVHPASSIAHPDLAILLHPWPTPNAKASKTIRRQFAKMRAPRKWILFKNQELWDGRFGARLTRRLLNIPRRKLLAAAERADLAILNREVSPRLASASLWQGPRPCLHPRAKTVFKIPRHEKFCPDCGSGFTPPEHAAPALELAKIYGPGYACYFRYTGLRCFMQFIENSVGAVGAYLRALGLDDTTIPADRRRVLDYGCGNGRYSLLWTRRGWRYLGVDYSADNIASAHKLFAPAGDSATFIQGGLDAPAVLESAPFGLIFLSHVLEHVPDPLELLTALRRLAAPGGWLYVEVPDAFRYTWNPAHRGYLSPEHLWDFAPAYLESLAREAGWRDIRLHSPGDPNCPWIALLARNEQ